MKNIKKSQSGSSIIELILLLLLILILILLGLYVASKNKKSKQTPPQQNVSQKTEKTPETVATVAYLKIPEWGVKIKLSADILDAYYDSNSSTTMSAFSLRTKSLDIEPDCKNGNQSVADIFKVKKDEIDPQYELEAKKYSQTQKGVTIGDSFYFTGESQYTCAVDKANESLLTKVKRAFVKASSDIEKL